MLLLSLGGGGSTITWVDAANYGLDGISHSRNGTVTASSLADWFCQAASTLQSLGRCGWQSTAASQAMHLYRSVYHHEPTLCHTHPLATSLERGALFGGRCEPFSLGRVDGPVHLYDFRSLYPYLYSTIPVPVRLAGLHDSDASGAVAAMDGSTYAIAKVDIETDKPRYPYRHERTVTFPTGRFTTYLAGAELRDALQGGNVRKVRRAALYETALSLRGYAESLYAIRQEADTRRDVLLAAYIKRLMNCLHGKFGQSESKWVDRPNEESPYEWAEWWDRLPSGEFQRIRSLAYHVQREEKGGFSHGSVPAIAVAIASAGRSRLMGAIERAGWGNIAYCDTDAIICNDEGAENLAIGGWIEQGEWGKLQHVISAEWAEIYGVKHYRIGDHYRCAGEAMGGRSESVDANVPSVQPGIRQRLSVQLPPADWREEHPYQRGPGRYDRQREPGGRVKPIHIDEWEK